MALGLLLPAGCGSACCSPEQSSGGGWKRGLTRPSVVEELVKLLQDLHLLKVLELPSRLPLPHLLPK